MTEAYGISGGGRSAENTYRHLTGASAAPKASIGDAVLDGNPVEIKRASSTTLNQVRAVKFIPLVAYHEPTNAWYVVPGHVVVTRVSSKTRGQHTENPFESATLSLSNLREFRLEDPAELRQRTLDAINESARYPALKKAMETVLAQSKDLALSSLTAVRKVMDSYDLRP